MFEVEWLYSGENVILTVFLSLVLALILFLFNGKDIRRVFSFRYVLLVCLGYLLVSYYFQEVFCVYFPEGSFYLPGLLLTVCLIGLLGAVLRMVKSVAVIGLWVAMIIFLLSPFISETDISHVIDKASEVQEEAGKLISNYPEVEKTVKASAEKMQKYWLFMSS